MLLMRDSLVYKLQIRDSLGYKRPWVRERAKRGYLEYNYAAEIHWVNERFIGLCDYTGECYT